MTAILDTSANTITISIPIKMRKRGGRKLVLAPDGGDWAPARPKVDNVMVKAIARAFRWRKLLETGAYTTIEELAAAERINPSYVSRLLRLTLLAPDIVEAILDRTHGPEATAATPTEQFPAATSLVNREGGQRTFRACASASIIGIPARCRASTSGASGASLETSRRNQPSIERNGVAA